MRLIAPLTLFLLAAPSLSFAQQTGYRDLTLSWRAPDDHIPSPSMTSCPSPKATISHGAVVNGVPIESRTPDPPDKVELTITEIVPGKLQIGQSFTATVRVKNMGSSTLKIPWQPDGEQATRASQDGTEEQYEVADVTFRLVTAGHKNSPTLLTSEGALFANPSDPMTYIEIAPNRWVDIKLSGTVECGLERCLGEIEPDDHAVLTAWWYQRLLTHRVKDCAEDHGSYEVRELNSQPFPVAIHGTPKPGGHTASQEGSTLTAYR
jgi:hypothetical protein